MGHIVISKCITLKVKWGRLTFKSRSSAPSAVPVDPGGDVKTSILKGCIWLRKQTQDNPLRVTVDVCTAAGQTNR